MLVSKKNQKHLLTLAVGILALFGVLHLLQMFGVVESFRSGELVTGNRLYAGPAFQRDLECGHLPYTQRLACNPGSL